MSSIFQHVGRHMSWGLDATSPHSTAVVVLVALLGLETLLCVRRGIWKLGCGRQHVLC